MKPPRSLTRLYPGVAKMTDAKRPVEIEVTARDVRGAGKGDAADCAMARAICREWKSDAAVIGMTYSYVVKGKTAVRFRTPESVQREIVSFDRHGDFEPGNYHLARVPACERGTTTKPSGPKRGKHRARRTVFHGGTLRVRNMRAG